MITAGRSSTASAKVLHTRCPLCGVTILSVGRMGVVSMEELRPVPLFSARGMGQGYLLCEDCFTLTELATDLSLN
jgi:hypothetical protein